MFVAFSKVFTPENLLYFAKGAVVSLLLAAVSLLFGIVFGILGSSAKRPKYNLWMLEVIKAYDESNNIKFLELLEMCMLKLFVEHQCYFKS